MMNPVVIATVLHSTPIPVNEDPFLIQDRPPAIHLWLEPTHTHDEWILKHASAVGYLNSAVVAVFHIHAGQWGVGIE